MTATPFKCDTINHVLLAFRDKKNLPTVNKTWQTTKASGLGWSSFTMRAIATRTIRDAMKPLSVSKTFMTDTLRRYKEIVMAADRPHLGHPRTKPTPEVVKRVQEKIRRNPCCRQTKLALKHNMSSASMQKLLKEDLHHLRRAQVFSDVSKKKRTDWAKEILNQMKTGMLINPVWSDFAVEAVFNGQNEKGFCPLTYCCCPWSKSLPPGTKIQPVMVWAAMSMEAKSLLVFVEPGVKITSQYDMNRILKDTLLPWADSLYGKNNWSFTQDGAPSHTSRIT